MSLCWEPERTDASFEHPPWHEEDADDAYDRARDDGEFDPCITCGAPREGSLMMRVNGKPYCLECGNAVLDSLSDGGGR